MDDKYMSNFFKKILLSTLLCSLLYNCQKQNIMTDTYSYETGSGCDSYYPIETYQQVFYSANQEMINIDGLGVQRGPWGNGGVTYIKNNESGNKIPSSLKVGYYSDTEDKFYEGEFKIPSQKIEEYLREKSPIGDTDEKEGYKYNRIEVGFALGGRVTLWMKGKNWQKELITVKAKEAFPEWNIIFDDTDRKEVVEDALRGNIFTEKVKNEVRTNSLPLNLWDIYDNRYNWKINLNLPAGGIVETTYIKRMINGEAEVIQGIDQKESKRALPYDVEFFWSLNGKKFNTRIIFGDQINYYNTIYKASLAKSDQDPYPADFRTQEVYQNFQQINQNEAAQIMVDFKANNNVLVSLKQADKTISFKNIITKTFEQ